MIWRTDKPTETVIVAKLTEDSCHLKNRYAILRLVKYPYQHYSEDGEEIPYAAIEKWASLEEEPDKGLEEAAHNYAWEKQEHHIDFNGDEYLDYGPRYDAFIAGAKWKAERVNRDEIFHDGMRYAYDQLMKEAVEGEIQMRYSGCLCAKTIRAINEDKFKLGDKVKLIIIKEDADKDFNNH